MSDGELRSIFQHNIVDFHWQSVETWSTGQGVPDVNYCGYGKEGWIEFKKTEAWMVDIRPEQVGWIERRIRNGGKVLIGVRRKHNGGKRIGDPTDELWLFKGMAARVLLKDRLTAVPSSFKLGSWPGGPSGWPWPEIIKILLI